MSHFINISDLVTKRLKKQDFITVKECAEINKIAPTMVYWLIRHNRIPGASRIGNQICIPQTWKYKPSRKGESHAPIKQKIMLDNPDQLQKFAR